jgi:hypothetical protein
VYKSQGFLGIKHSILWFCRDFEAIDKHYILRFWGQKTGSQYVVVGLSISLSSKNDAKVKANKIVEQFLVNYSIFIFVCR